MRKVLLIYVIVMMSSICYAQNSSDLLVDSLVSTLRTTDKISAEIYNQQISRVFKMDMPINEDKFEYLIKTTIEIAQENNNQDELAQANYNLGKFHISGNSNYSKAIPALLEGLALFDQLKDSTGISRCYMQLGLIGYVTQYFEDGIKNFKLSLNYADNPTSNYLMAITYTELEDFDEAKKHFIRAITTYKSSNNASGLIECFMYLGKLYQDEGKLDSALFYLNWAISDQIRFNEQDVTKRPYALISGYYLKVNNLDRAKYFAHISLKHTQNSSDQISAMLAAETLSKVYEIEKDYEKAHTYLKLYYKLMHRSVQGSTKQKIAEMQSMFDFKKRMNEEKLVHQEEIRQKNRTENIFLVSGIFVLIITGGLWSRLQYVRNSRAEIQSEKDRSESLLLNILPAEIAQELKEKGKAEARDFDMVSILFTDFIGFTEQSAKLSATDLVDEINYCFEGFDGIMEKYNIEKIKTIGDAYMAAGGLPVPTDNSIKNTVLVALEMQAFITSRKAKMDAQNKPAFEMRVGIHTGPVVAGIVGVKKFQYDIWGDTVNTASRMESNGEAGKVNISEATFNLLKTDKDFAFESRGKIEAKGKGGIEMYFVNSNKQMKL